MRSRVVAVPVAEDLMKLAGSVRQRGSRYQVRFRAAGRETSRSFATEFEAGTFCRELTARSTSARDALAWGNELTIADVAAMWARDRGFRERTLRTNEGHLANHILPHLGHIPIGKLTRPMLRDWIAALELAPKTKQRVLGVVRQTMCYARDAGYIEHDPTAGLRVAGAGRRTDLVLPTVGAVEALCEMIDPRCSVGVDVMAFAGATIGELGAMRVGDLDFEDQTVSICRSQDITSNGAVFITDGMKTPTRDRVVPVVPAHVWDRWEFLAGRESSDLLVPSPTGKLLHPGNFRTRFFAPAVAATAGCPPSLTPHDLRHFACSLWVAVGFSDYDAAHWAGHTDTGLIRRTYGHALPRDGTDFEQEILESVRTQRTRPRLK